MGALLLIPFFLVRFGLLSRLDKTAIQRAAHFAPMKGKEKAAYWIHQLSNAAIFLYLFLLPIKTNPALPFYAGIAVYLAGAALLILSVIGFSAPAESGINRHGPYALSRNPMYVAYFVFFMGCVLLTQSLILLSFVLVFQIAAHWIILAEERWCLNEFGEEYREYTRQARRYF